MRGEEVGEIGGAVGGALRPLEADDDQPFQRAAGEIEACASPSAGRG